MRFYDAHNHLQDDRFGGRQAGLVAACAEAGVARMVVNGSCEEDWSAVLALARAHPEVLPSFGCHPWYLAERTPEWLARLAKLLDAVPSAVGETGLDRWKAGLDYAGQEEALVAQLELAARRDRPVSIHCLQAWGALLRLLEQGPRPRRGFLLHSFGGPAEMVPALARLGAYFSFPGYFLQERKLRQRAVFKAVPLERLLVETDAPDQLWPGPPTQPGGATFHTLADALTGRPIHHPANLPAIYEGLAVWLGVALEELSSRVEENFLRLFGGL